MLTVIICIDYISVCSEVCTVTVYPVCVLSLFYWFAGCVVAAVDNRQSAMLGSVPERSSNYTIGCSYENEMTRESVNVTVHLSTPIMYSV